MLLPNAASIPPQTGGRVGFNDPTASGFHDVRGEFEHGARNLIAFAQQNMGGQAERMTAALNAFVSNMKATNFEPNPSSEIFGQGKELFVEFCRLMQDSRIELKDRIKAFNRLAYSLGGCGAAVIFGLQEAVCGLKSPGNDVHAQMFESRQRLIDATLQQLVRDTFKVRGSAELNQHDVAVLKNRLGFLDETQYSSDLALTQDAFNITDELVRHAEQAIKKNVSHCHVPLFMAKNILETLEKEISKPLTVRKLEVKLIQLSQQFGKIPREAVVKEKAGGLSLATNPSLLARCLLQNLTEIGLCPKQDPVVLCKWETSANKTRSIAIYGECIPYIQAVTDVGPQYLDVTTADLKKLQAEVAAKNIDAPSPQTMLALAASSASDEAQPASPEPRYVPLSANDIILIEHLPKYFRAGIRAIVRTLMQSLSRAAYDPKKIFECLQTRCSEGRTILCAGLKTGLGGPVSEFVEGLAGLKSLTSRQKQDILEAKDMAGFHGLYTGVVQGRSSTVRGFLEALSTFEDLSSDQKFEIVQAKAPDGTSALEMALQKKDDSETVIAILESLPPLGLSSRQIQEILSIEKVIGLKLEQNSLITFFGTALVMAVNAEDTETVRVILAAIASPRLGLEFEQIKEIVCAEDVLYDGKSALLVAFSQTDTDILSVLLEALPGLGFQSDQILEYLRTGLDWAIHEQSTHSVKFILGALSRLDLDPRQNAEFLETIDDKGEEVLLRTLRHGNNPFALAILDAMPDLTLDADHLQELLNVEDLDGFKRLFTLAINEGGTETVKMLLDVLCELELSSDQKAEFMGARDRRGETILSRALQNGDTDMVEAVLVAMNDLKLEAHQVQTILEVKNQAGQSAMFDAVWNNHTDTLKVFLESLSNMPWSSQQLENLLAMEDALGQTLSVIAETDGNTELEEALKPLRSKIKAVPE